MTQIYIDSKVCEELSISYDSKGEYNSFSIEEFVEAWKKCKETPYYITVKPDYEDAVSSRVPFDEFISVRDSINLKNTGAGGYFEI